MYVQASQRNCRALIRVCHLYLNEPFAIVESEVEDIKCIDAIEPVVVVEVKDDFIEESCEDGLSQPECVRVL